jgi:hypothetical protein
MDTELHKFLTTEFRVASLTCRPFYLSGIHWLWCWEDPRANLQRWRRQEFLGLTGTKPRSPGPQPSRRWVQCKRERQKERNRGREKYKWRNDWEGNGEQWNLAQVCPQIAYAATDLRASYKTNRTVVCIQTDTYTATGLGSIMTVINDCYNF